MFTFKSTRLSAELKRRREQFESRGILLGTIHVPPEMIWWGWQEFGTALYAERGTDNPSGYYVPSPDNIDAKILMFPNQEGTIIRVKEVYTRGIPPHHMVTSIEGDIREYVGAGILKIIIESNYNVTALETALLEVIMPKVKEMIRVSFAENLMEHPDRERGRLLGTPADEFEDKATITVEAV